MASYSLFPDRKCLLFHTGASGHHLSVLEKLHPGLPLLWHQEFMTCPESGIQSLPELRALCWRFYQNPALRSGPIGQGMPGSPSSSTRCPWPSIRKYQHSCNLQLCDRADNFKGIDWAEKFTGISFSFSFLFQLAVFFDCRCCHHIKKVPKATSLQEQLSWKKQKNKKKNKIMPGSP